MTEVSERLLLHKVDRDQNTSRWLIRNPAIPWVGVQEVHQIIFRDQTFVEFDDEGNASYVVLAHAVEKPKIKQKLRVIWAEPWRGLPEEPWPD